MNGKCLLKIMIGIQLSTSHGMDGAGLIDFLLAHKSTLKPTIVYPLKKMNMMIKL
jgi:hypothetical protein